MANCDYSFYNGMDDDNLCNSEYFKHREYRDSKKCISMVLPPNLSEDGVQQIIIVPAANLTSKQHKVWLDAAQYLHSQEFASKYDKYNENNGIMSDITKLVYQLKFAAQNQGPLAQYVI